MVPTCGAGRDAGEKLVYREGAEGAKGLLYFLELRESNSRNGCLGE
jgi:hypothetical protein